MKAKKKDSGETSHSLSLVDATPLPYSFDALDKRILQLLAKDGREAFVSIAAELGVDEKTVRYRVGKMRAAGALMFHPSLNPNRVDSCVVISLGLKLNSDGKRNAELIAQRISQLPKVSWCGTTLGLFDLLVEVALERFEDVRAFQLHGLKDIPEVESFETFVIMSHHGRRGIPISPDS